MYIVGVSDICFACSDTILIFTSKMIYAYIRVCTDKQTVENQKIEVEKFACVRELNIDKWISETVSGTKSAKKRKLGPLIKKLKTGETLIAVTSSDDCMTEEEFYEKIDRSIQQAKEDKFFRVSTNDDLFIISKKTLL